MMKQLLFLLFFPLLLLSCREGKPQYTDGLKYLADSFDLSGFSSGYGISYLKCCNRDTIISFDRVAKTLSYYRYAKEVTPVMQFKLAADNVYKAKGFFKSDTGRLFYFYNEETKDLAVYSDSLRELYHHTVNYNPVYSFMIEPNWSGPFYTVGDTVIVDVMYGKSEEVDVFDKHGNVFAEWVVNKDTFYVKDEYVRPSDWKLHYEQYPSYCLVNNKLYYVYADFDSLYCYDRSTRKISVKHIHNKAYTKPEPFHSDKIGQPDYWAYNTKYFLHNFQYLRIVFNATTRHFILFYHEPVAAVKGEVATTDDQPLKALILDEHFNQLDNVVFGKHYFNPKAFFEIRGKGIVLPIWKKDINEKDTVYFDIYNF